MSRQNEHDEDEDDDDEDDDDDDENMRVYDQKTCSRFLMGEDGRTSSLQTNRKPIRSIVYIVNQLEALFTFYINQKN